MPAEIVSASLLSSKQWLALVGDILNCRHLAIFGHICLAQVSSCWNATNEQLSMKVLHHRGSETLGPNALPWNNSSAETMASFVIIYLLSEERSTDPVGCLHISIKQIRPAQDLAREGPRADYCREWGEIWSSASSETTFEGHSRSTEVTHSLTDCLWCPIRNPQ